VFCVVQKSKMATITITGHIFNIYKYYHQYPHYLCDDKAYKCRNGKTKLLSVLIIRSWQNFQFLLLVLVCCDKTCYITYVDINIFFIYKVK